MAGLVQDRHQAGRGVRLVVARGHADVVGHAAAERVQALVQAALVEVEAERLHQPLAERLLRGRRKVSLQRQRRDLVGQDALEKVRQESGERLEQGVDLGGADAWLVAIQERIVGRPAECCGLGCGLLPDEAHDLLERRAQHGEIGARSRLAPDHLGSGRGAHQGRDQIRRHGHRAPVAAAHLAQVRCLPRLEPGRVLLGLIQEIAGLGAGQQLVRDLAERRHLLGAHRAAARRHHHLMVPLQDGERAADVRHAREARLKRAIGFGHEPPAVRRRARWRAP